MKIDVGMFVRTERGKIWLVTSTKAVDGHRRRIVNADYNILKLIQVGDYVNGYKVYYCYCADEDSTGLFIDTEKGRQWLDKPSQIKSIVTKEQFEQMEYKVGDLIEMLAL